jgi:small subunit ribosomal protein S18
MATKTRAPRRRPGPEGRGRKKRVCQFCADSSIVIDYKEVAVLRKYMSDRGKIRSRRVTGACALHQRRVAHAIKNAREMALLPYVQVRS